MNILVTGGTGFLGSEFLEKYSSKYHIFAAYRRAKGIERENIRWIRLDLCSRIDFVRAYNELKKEKITAIVHIGGATPNRAYKDGNFDATVEGTRYLLELGRRLRVKKFIFISSMCVSYPYSGPYADSKRNAESAIIRSKIPYTILRPDMIIGAGAKDFLRVVKILSKTKVFPIIGKGDNTMRPIPSTDLVDIIDQCINDRQTENKTFSVFGSEEITNQDFLSKIASLGGNKVFFIKIPKKPALFLSYFFEKISPKMGINRERMHIYTSYNRYDLDQMKLFAARPTSLDRILKNIYKALD